MIDQAALDHATDVVLARGIRVLQGNRLAPTERAHVSELLRRMNPHQGARILDVGCGVGEVAKLMREERDDLSFILVNFNLHQLELAPPDMGRLHCDMHNIGLPDNAVDGAMILYTMCHADLERMLREVARVVRPGGFVFIYDYLRHSGTNDDMVAHLSARAHRAEELDAAFTTVGMTVVSGMPAHGDDTLFRYLFADHTLYDRIFSELEPRTWLLRNMKATLALIDMEPIERHAKGKIALSFSGGKDSLAVLYMLRPYLDWMTVYHLDTGDLLPETVEIVSHVEAMVPNFVRVRSDVQAWIDANGLPTDLMPHSAHEVGQHMGEGARLVPRYDCCYRNLMLPLYRRIVDDGNTLLIRGTKRVDMARLPAQSGSLTDGVELFYPLLDWSNDAVFAYLRSVGAPINRVYDYVVNSPECARCSAWWGERRAAYLREHHPRLWAEYMRRLLEVSAAVVGPMQNLTRELESL